MHENSCSTPLLDSGVEHLLETCQHAAEAGVLAAIYDALIICDEHGVSEPHWLRQAVLGVLDQVFAGKLSKGVGPTANPISKYKQDMRHYARWNAVLAVRVESYLSWEDTYAAAAEKLTGTPYYGGPETIKKSYLKVNKALKDPSQAPRFYLAQFAPLESLGNEN